MFVSITHQNQTGSRSLHPDEFSQELSNKTKRKKKKIWSVDLAVLIWGGFFCLILISVTKRLFKTSHYDNGLVSLYLQWAIIALFCGYIIRCIYFQNYISAWTFEPSIFVPWPSSSFGLHILFAWLSHNSSFLLSGVYTSYSFLQLSTHLCCAVIF